LPSFGHSASVGRQKFSADGNKGQRLKLLAKNKLNFK